MIYLAGKRIKVGDEYREPGDLVPEAEEWQNIAPWLGDGSIIAMSDEAFEQMKANLDKAEVPTPEAAAEAETEIQAEVGAEEAEAEVEPEPETPKPRARTRARKTEAKEEASDG